MYAEFQEEQTTLRAELADERKTVGELQDKYDSLRDEIATLHVYTRINSSTPGPLAVGTIVMWAGDVTAVPEGWTLCNGAAGAPDLSGKFVLGASPQFPAGSSQAVAPPPPPLQGGAFGFSEPMCAQWNGGPFGCQDPIENGTYPWDQTGTGSVRDGKFRANASAPKLNQTWPKPPMPPMPPTTRSLTSCASTRRAVRASAPARSLLTPLWSLARASSHRKCAPTCAMGTARSSLASRCSASSLASADGTKQTLKQRQDGAPRAG